MTKTNESLGPKLALVRTLGALLFSLVLWSPPVAAQDVETARALFNAGANAYNQEKYLAAIQAFEQAHALSKRSGLLFSIAQSYRRQYYLDLKPSRMRSAISYYEQYLKEGGERRAEANEALSELRPMMRTMAARMEAEGQPAQTEPAKVELTQLSVNSPTRGARLILDGKDRGPLPFIEEVEPGERKVAIVADGFVTHERVQKVPKGQLLAVDVELQEKPAQVALSAPEGAKVNLDGRFIGDAPLSPLSLAPGSHFLSVTQNGSEAYARELELGRDERLSVSADLAMSDQRVAALSLLGVGAAGLVNAGVFGALALSEQADADEIRQWQQEENITADDRDAYLEARAARDDYRTVTWISLAAGGALCTLGTILFVFDEPRITAPSVRRERKVEDTLPKEEQSMEVGFVPVLSPTTGGASVVGRF